MHSVAPLVCRRWWPLSRSPALLRELVIQLPAPRRNRERGALLLPRLSSLAGWMGHAARHVAALDLDVAGTCSQSEDAEAEGLVAAIVAACGAAGSLRRLTLRPQLWDDYCHETDYDQEDMSMHFSGWLLLLDGVRSLPLVGATQDDDGYSARLSRRTVPLCSLSSCQRLSLAKLHFQAASAQPEGQPPAVLPAGLTFLELESVRDYGVPSLVSCIAALLSGGSAPGLVLVTATHVSTPACSCCFAQLLPAHALVVARRLTAAA